MYCDKVILNAKFHSVNCSLRLRHFAMNIFEELRERRENVNIPTRDETSVNTRQGDKQENEALPDHMLVDASEPAAQSAEGERPMRAVRFDTERQHGRLFVHQRREEGDLECQRAVWLETLASCAKHMLVFDW